MRKTIIKVKKIISSEDTQVLIYFNNNTTTQRKIYYDKKYKYKYFCDKYKKYKLIDSDNIFSGEYTFEFIEDYRPVREVEGIRNARRESEASLVSNYEKNPAHSKEDLILSCISKNIPVYLSGPAGPGKNFVLQKIANKLELEFYFTNSVQQEYKITGFIDAGGIYHETEFYKAFRHGGLFFLDEIDASIPEILILLNAAIANRYFEFPNGRIDAHEDFRVVAAGNTVGTGANEVYNGRLMLDQATLDRFAIIEFDYERKIELSIAKGNVQLVDFIRELRRISKQSGIRTTFSYRCIMMVKELEKDENLDLSIILKVAVFKGLSQDDINIFSLYDDSSKYGIALRKLQDN